MRKLLLFILVSILSVIAHSCGDSITTPSLLEAERLAENEPDSALSILDTLSPALLRNDDERMLRRLLILEAKDRMEVSQKDDKEITALLDYFINGNHLKRIHPLVYYYAGRVYSDQNEYAKALGYYKKALRSIDKNGDILLERRIHGQISYIFEANGIYRHALRELKQYSALSDSIAQLKPSKLNIYDKISARISVAECYRALGMTDSSLNIYLNLEPEVKQFRDSSLFFTYYLSFANLYLRTGHPEKADSVISDKKISYNKASKNFVIITLAEIEKSKATPNINKEEMEELLSSDILYDRYFAARTLAEMADKENDGTHLLKYSKLAHSLSYKLQKATNDASLVEMEKILDETEIENENNQLKSKHQHIRLILVFAISIAVIIILILIIFSLKGRIKKKELTAEIEELKRNNRLEILKMENEISRLKDELESAEDTQRIQRIEDNLLLAQITEEITRSLMTPGSRPTEEDFTRLKKAFNIVQPEFISQLESLNLKPRDFKDALLIKIKIPQKLCADFFDITPQGVANQRRRLFKTFGKDSGNKDWKDFILSL